MPVALPILPATRCCGAWAAALIALGWGAAGAAWGQFGDSAARPAVRLAVARDAEAERWLDRAADAARQKDWKLLVDTLYHVVDRHAPNTVSVRSGEASTPRLCAAGQRAWELLAGAGPEAVAVFRLTYQAQAAAAMADARRNGSEDALRAVVRRYLPTAAGAEAADLLAARLLDRSQWNEALRTLDLLETFGDHGRPAWSLLLRRAVASAGAGRRQDALAALEQATALLRDARTPDLSERLRRVREFVDARPATADAVAISWPALLGPTSSRGRMPAVNGDVFRSEPTTRGMPGAGAIDRFAAMSLADDANRCVVWQAVTDGATLFVSTPNGFAALDPVSLEFRWLPVTSAEKVRRRVSRAPGDILFLAPDDVARRRDRSDPAARRAVFDETAGMLAVVDGLVFCIDQSGVTLPPGMETMAIEQDELIENTLSAYDAAGGKLLWQKGRSGPAEDGLTGAHFFAPPVASRGRFLALVQLASELSLLVLDRGGKIHQRVALGSAPESAFPAGRVLPLAATDDEVFVATGLSVLLCLRAGDFSLAWAAEYARTSERTRTPFARGRIRVFVQGAPAGTPDAWLANPPLVTEQAVILAPVDSTDLIAVRRSDGARLWRRTNLAGFRYLVGADDRHVYIQGDHVEALRLNDGVRAWAYHGSPLTGRAALCDAHLLIPTREDVVCLDAHTGAKLRPAADAPRRPGLGNLLAWDGAVYSVEVDRVRRFGDPARDVEQARRRLEENPSDAAARIKLATLYVASRQYAQALETVEHAAPGPGEAETDADGLAHLGVQACLGLVRQRLASPDAADLVPGSDDLLARAAGWVRRRTDRIDLARVTSEHLWKCGRKADAARRLAVLAEELGDAPLPLPDERIVRTTLWVAQRLAALWPDLEPDERAALTAEWRSQVDRAAADGRIAPLRRLADALGVGDAGAMADLRLAVDAQTAGMRESVEFHLRRAASRAASAPLAAEALARLAVHLASPPAGLAARPRAAEQVLARLRELPADTPLSVAPPARPAQGGATLPGFLDAFATAGTDVAAAPRPAVPQPLRAAEEFVRGPEHGHPGVALTMATWAASGADADDLAHHLGIVITTENVIGVDLAPSSRAQMRWRLDLSMLPGDDAADPVLRGQASFPSGVAVPLLGSVAAIPTPRGVYFVDVTTGGVVSPPIVPPFGREGLMPATPAVAAGDVFVIAADPHSLVAVPACGNASPRWRRTVETRQIEHLHAMGPYVAVAGAAYESVWVIATADAALVRTVRGAEEQASGAEDLERITPRRPAAFCGTTLVTLAGREVRCIDLPTGAVAWTKVLRKPCLDVQVIDPGLLGVSDADALHLLAAADGRLVASVAVADALLPPLDAVLAGRDTLLLLVATDDTPPEVRLDWFDLTTGERWRRRGPWPQATVTPEMMRGAPDVVPVVARSTLLDEALGPIAPGGRVAETARLLLYDKATGERIGRPIDLGRESAAGLASAPQVVDVRTVPGGMLVVTQYGRQLVGPGVSGP